MFEVPGNSYSVTRLIIPVTRTNVCGIFIKIQLPRLLATEIWVPSKSFQGDVFWLPLYRLSLFSYVVQAMIDFWKLLFLEWGREWRGGEGGMREGSWSVRRNAERTNYNEIHLCNISTDPWFDQGKGRHTTEDILSWSMKYDKPILCCEIRLWQRFIMGSHR